MKVIFFIKMKHSRFVRIRDDEQFSPAPFTEVVKQPQKKMFWAWVTEPLSKWGAQVRDKKTIESFRGLNWQL